MKAFSKSLVIAVLTTATSIASPFAELQQTPPEAEVGKKPVHNKDLSIIAQSTIITDGTNWTILPKGAVLHTPVALQSKVSKTPVGKLLPWAEFLVKNRAWVGTQEVDMDLAAGTKPVPEAWTENWKKQNMMIVAVYESGPISILPPKVAKETSTVSAQ